MGIFDSINISASALTAEKTRIDIINKNIANAHTTKTTGGRPYRRQLVVFQENKPKFSYYLDKKKEKFNGQGVSVSNIVEDQSEFKRIYEPGHPHADENGYVLMPNVDMVKEMVDMIDAQRAYEANITAMNGTKSMLMKALEIGRR